MTYWFIMGTAAELIKMLPLVVDAQERKVTWFLWATGQGSNNFWKQYDDFALPRQNAFCLDPRAKDLESSGEAAAWLARNFFRSSHRLAKEIDAKVGRHPQDPDICFVHGDTFSTLLGAIYARRLGCRVAHVEAGMRSGSIWSPFPEEFNRRRVSGLAQLHFAPDDRAVSFLKKEKRKGKIIPTGGNSVFDALFAILSRPRPVDLPNGTYVVANLHRFENLQSRERWNTIVETSIKAAKIAPVYFVMHPPTEHLVSQSPGLKERLQKANVILWGRQSYSRFVHLLAGANFVLTDGGSNQTECAYLGMPCLIMRDRTELPEGLGKNCVLSRLDEKVIDDFLSSLDRYRYPRELLETSPTKIISKALQEIEVLPPIGPASELAI